MNGILRSNIKALPDMKIRTSPSYFALFSFICLVFTIAGDSITHPFKLFLTAVNRPL